MTEDYAKDEDYFCGSSLTYKEMNLLAKKGSRGDKISQELYKTIFERYVINSDEIDWEEVFFG